MSWHKVKLIWLRELRDQMRDRRTLFTVAVLPILLYPLIGMVFLQVSNIKGTKPTKILIIGKDELPESPPLIEYVEDQPRLIKYVNGQPQASAAEDSEADLLKIVIADAADYAGLSQEEVREQADAAIDNGDYDAVVYFPPGFRKQLAAYRRRFERGGDDGQRTKTRAPTPLIFANTSKDKSRFAKGRIESVLDQWGSDIYERTLEARGVPITDIHPIRSEMVDVAESSSIRAHLWSKILPFVLMVWALTGAFYPAIDLCAGEKERGTLETLLTSPARRGEIVWGKLLAVTTFSIATAILNLLSLTATGTFVMKAADPTGSAASMNIGPPPLSALGWLLVALVPAAFMFSALALAIAAMARSSKEGQYYLLPLLFVSMPLMVLPILPATELSLGTSLVPITGLIFVLRQLIEGEYLDALRYAVPVVGVTALCVWVSIRWAIDQFNKEEVLFRESEQFSLGVWLRHLVRDRQATPTLHAALLMGALLLVLRFFSVFALNQLFPMPQSWSDFTITTLITLVGLIALPVVLASLLLTRNPRETLSLKQAPPFSLVAALTLALCVHPLLHEMQKLVQFVFPAGQSGEALEKAFSQILSQAPNKWAVLLLIAVAPAICEELAFRGYILSGLRHMGHKWGAIVLSAAFFGVAHGILQQSLLACMTGVVLGYIAVQTGSLWPCMVYHFTNNAAVLILGGLDEHLVSKWPILGWFFAPAVDGNGLAFAWWVAVAGAALAAAILWWFARLPHQATREEELQKALDHQRSVEQSAKPVQT